MTRTLSIAVSVLLAVSLLRTQPGNCQNYDDLLRAVSQLQETLTRMATERALQLDAQHQYADIEGMATVEEPGADPILEFVENMQKVMDEFEQVVKETKKAEKGRKNPAGIGHGQITLTGFLHQRYYNLSGDNEQTTFESKCARLGVKGSINKFARIKLVGEFAKSPKLLDAKLTISPDRHWSFSVGQYKTPFGTDFLTSSTSLPFVNNSMAKGLGPDRDIGAEICWNQKINNEYSIKLLAGVFNGAGINTTDANSNKNVAVRAVAKLGSMFTVAPNVYFGRNNRVDESKEAISTLGGSVTWDWRDVTLASEYIYSKVGESEKAGWYLWGAYSFTTNSNFLPEIQALFRYEQYDGGLGITGNRKERITLGTNLFIDKKYTKIQVNYQVNGEESESINNNEFLVNFQVAF